MQIPMVPGASYGLLRMDRWMDELGWHQHHPFSPGK